MLNTARLTLITQTSRLDGEPFFHTLQEALAGGVDQVLVREKTMDSAKLLAFASRIRSITDAFHASLIIHSQADVAKAVQADGVHVSSHDMAEIPAIRHWLNSPDMMISTACHNLAELQQAEAWGADLAYLSPVFATQTHPDTPPLGIPSFQAITQTSRLPMIALGGITPDNRAQLKGYGVAVIGAILDAHDPRQAAQDLCEVKP